MTIPVPSLAPPPPAATTSTTTTNATPTKNFIVRCAQPVPVAAAGAKMEGGIPPLPTFTAPGEEKTAEQLELESSEEYA